MSNRVSKMLIGGFLLINIMVYNLFFRTDEYSKGFEVSAEAKRYFKLMGLVIYHAFIELYYQKIRADPDNVAVITQLVNIPTKTNTPLYYSKIDDLRPPDHILEAESSYSTNS